MGDETIGKALRTRRAQLGFDQREAATRIGMSRTTFSSYERDTQRPSVDVLPAIADFLEISIDDVLVLFGASAVAAARTALGRLGPSPSPTPPQADTDIHTSDVRAHFDAASTRDDFVDGYASNNGGGHHEHEDDVAPSRPVVSIDLTPPSRVKAHDESDKGKKKKKKKGKREKLVNPAFTSHV
jgi:transcriptional regulator with XRE-family HTH domain